MLGQLGADQAGQPVADLDLLDLQAVQEAAQGVGQLQGRAGADAGRRARAPVSSDDQPGEFEAPAQGLDGGGQVERQVAGLERRLAGLQVAQGRIWGGSTALPPAALMKASASARAPRRVGVSTTASARASGPMRASAS